jgi:hypothetical protein
VKSDVTDRRPARWQLLFRQPPQHARPAHRHQEHGHRRRPDQSGPSNGADPQTADHGQSRCLSQANPIRRNGQAGQSERILRPSRPKRMPGSLAIGNPDDPNSHFAKACKPGSGWNVIKISAFDTPAYTGEKVPEELPPLLVSPTWLRTHANAGVWIRRCTSPRSMASFPEVSEKTLIPVSWITAAQERRLEPEG